ncbi:uncharacterized protein LOC120709378 isoform X2 [Panicum virgatum]|uniref:uncharacterized protein LOC120709378 isoform X2 n=1 Tax=Panicum virgatum TaxID=38727 RepID=UPI0019D4F7E4|nr:uncharacterized protein LOC120709378 isoform X2 [Panicum virgatum]
MQSLFLHCIVLYTEDLPGLYCLSECQPYKPQFKVYLSLEECRQLKGFVVMAKQNGLHLAPALVKRMCNKGMFLFGYMNSLGDDSEKQGAEFELDSIKKLSKEYAEAKELAFAEAGQTVNIEDAKHILQSDKLLGDKIDDEAVKEWDAQKEFYERTGQ